MTLKELNKRIASGELKSNLRKEDIKGAPFKIGSRVKVLSNPNDDETFESTFTGKIGEVFFFEYDCGCGQTFPNDPMIGVKFQNGKVEEFWKEELELIF